MIEIRKMTVLDTKGVLDLVEEFKQEALNETKISFDRTTLKRRLDDAILNDVPIIFVAVDKEKVIGVIAGVLINSYFDINKKMATEFIWYVNKKYRGNSASVRLLKTFEKYCKENKADTVTMIAPHYSENSKEIGFFYERQGYKKLETHYLKEV